MDWRGSDAGGLEVFDMKQGSPAGPPEPPRSAAAAPPDGAWLSAIIQSANIAIVSKTLDGVVTGWNPAAEQLFGYSAAEAIGRSIRLIVPERLQSEEDSILASIKRGEKVEHFETQRVRKDGREISISVTVSPIIGPDGAIVGASKIARDISKELEARHRLVESEERFRTLADNISQFAWMADAKGSIFWYNKRWFDYTGTTLEEMRGWGWRAVHHPDHVERVAERIQYSWDTGELWEDTFPLRGADGEYRWFLSRAVPIRDDAGKIVRWFGTNTDITEQKDREEQIRFLIGEVNHRAKNMLALVQAVARQTAGEHNAEFVDNFGKRLDALGASQNLLLGSGWKGANIESLVESQLGHFKDLIGARILVSGEPVKLSGSAAQALGMALHELATNAGKYGALSNDTGRVEIAWRLLNQEDGQPPRLEISWRESGGPPVTPPTRRGFGSKVIDRMCRTAFAGAVTLDFKPEGLQWTLLSGAGQGLDTERPRKADQGGQRILVVEDEVIIALDLCTALERAGFEVVGPAVSAAEALRLLQSDGCDAAVLDVNLGAETSEVVADALQAIGTPYMIVSGHRREHQPSAFQAAPFLEKPVDTPDVIAALTRIMAARAS